MATAVAETHIGLTFYGGVSLAVFEAGIAYELVRAVQYSREAGGMPELPRLHVDVVTGTSAGGLAAFQIAAALAGRDTDAVLREMLMLWSDTADIGNLLERRVDDGLLDNTPLRSGAESLLRIATEGGDPPLETEMDVVLTLTNLDGLGEPVIIDDVDPDTRRPRTLSFPTARYVEYEHFTAADILNPEQHSRITDAAVITAGFPVAFAPTLKPSSAIAGSGADQPFCYVDGGLMDNRPLGVALDYIGKRPAEDRWFFFIDPNEVWVDPSFGSIMTTEASRDPWSIARRLFGVARSDTIFDDLTRVRDMRDTLGIMYELRNALLADDTRSLEALERAYPEVVKRRFNPEAWSLWMLIQPHVEDDAAIQAAWARVADQERLRLRVRLREYVRHLARREPPLLSAGQRDDLLALIDNPGSDPERPPPSSWDDYYAAVAAVQAQDSTLRQLRYRAWRKIKTAGLDRAEDQSHWRALDSRLPEGHIASIEPHDPKLAEELRHDDGAGLNRDIATALTDLNQAAGTLAEIRRALTAWFVARIAAETTDRDLETHARWFDHYARGMQVLESLAGVSYTPSLKVERITPFDIYSEDADRAAQRPLAGGELAAFGGFLDKAWRLNDFLVGRLTLRCLLARKGLLPRAAFTRATNGSGDGPLDYVSWCNARDSALLEGLPPESPERAALEAFVHDHTPLPYAGDHAKPGYLLTPAQMDLKGLATPRLAVTLSKLAGSLRHQTHDTPHARQQPYQSLRPVSAVAERLLSSAERVVTRKGVRDDSGLNPILKPIEKWLIALAIVVLAVFALLFVLVLAGADWGNLWGVLLVPALALAVLAGFVTDGVRRIRRWLGRPASAPADAPDPGSPKP